MGNVSRSFYRDLTKGRKAARTEAKTAGAFLVYRLKKNGQPGSQAHVSWCGDTSWHTEAEAQIEAQRMMGLNQGSTYIVIKRT